MIISISPSRLNGSIQAPASKSSMQRACAAALLNQGRSNIYNPGHSNDDKAALEIIQKLGAVLAKVTDQHIEIESSYVQSAGIRSKEGSIHCGESGLSIRMFTPLAALCSNEITITGSGSLVSRPMDFFDEILPQLGVSVRSNGGKLPLTIQGPLQPRDIRIDGSLSSQFLTGLLMAFGALPLTAAVTIEVIDLKSKPYIDLTLDVMQKFGLNLPVNDDYKAFRFLPSPVSESVPASRSYTVEGDWSGGAFLLVAGAIAGPITVRGLSMASTQADRKITEALISAGAGFSVDAKEIRLQPKAMKAFEFDATDCPDLFPPLTALAAFCEGVTKIKGVSRLAHKESDRGITLQQEFGKMGLKIELDDDWMLVFGGGSLMGTDVHSRHDHRIAMACAVAALGAEGITRIAEAQAVDKSYPDFYGDLQALGGEIGGGVDWKSAADIS